MPERPQFASNWTARLLTAPPLIAPARQFTYPHPVPGEEDALARGAVLIEIKPAAHPLFLATCALGFRSATLAPGIFACPRPDDLLALAGGYAYLIDTVAPERCLHLPVRPVTAVLPAPEAGVILLAGFHHVAAIDHTGLRWESRRLSWEGITLTGVRDGVAHGLGWQMSSDKELPFAIDLATGTHTGGGYP
jgi:hypothetical protein